MNALCGEPAGTGSAMSPYSEIAHLLFVVTVLVCVTSLVGYEHRVLTRRRSALDRLCVPVERRVYRVADFNAAAEMDAGQCAICTSVFTHFSRLLLYIILMFQHFLPSIFLQCPTTRLARDPSFNTAASFSTDSTCTAYAMFDRFDGDRS